ncbi:hypothetical protein RCL1_002623 [Eukaryota sp. TZLM3-RCL]
MSDFGVIGLAVMGKNIALNVERNGYKTSVFNRTYSKTEQFASEHHDKNFFFAKTIEEFTNSLALPRKILVMVQAGKPVDDLIEQLLPHLSEGDIVMDGGNSYYEDSDKRFARLAQRNIHFVGLGISGGELGALYGPSLMPGTSVQAWNFIKPILESIAARAPKDNQPCVALLGPGGAGHAVKTVHNGIEYALMQLIAECYDLLKSVNGLSADEISSIFLDFGESELKSYLVEIAAVVLKHKQSDGTNTIDLILDSAKQKGTGRWTSEIALKYGVSIPTIDVSTSSRYMSAQKDLRVEIAQRLGTQALPKDSSVGINRDEMQEAMLCAYLLAYTQGLDLLTIMSREHSYNTNMASVAAVWRAGCIIRSEFLLQLITDAYTAKPDLRNMLLDEEIGKLVTKTSSSLRKIVTIGIANGVPVAAFSSCIAYLDQISSARLPANMIQGLRDCFGAHTYQRIDKGLDEVFHTEWN